MIITDKLTKKSLIKNFKFNFKATGKYWNTENIYPTNEDDFIEEFFQNRKLDFLEGIWDEEKWGLVGIVKEKSIFQMYDINITNQLYDKFQKKHLDYKVVSGTKSGAFFPTNNKKNFKGNLRIVHIVPSNPKEGIDSTQYFIQPSDSKMKILNENTLEVKITGYDNRIFKNHRVWPIDIKEHNQSFSSSPSKNIAKELKDLKEMYKDGTLSKSEFTKAKNKLLK